MTSVEFEEGFDVYYNNITSNQAPGLNTYEKCLFLTKAQDEILKNYFTANSKGNNIGQGFDDSAKRQADFSSLMRTAVGGIATAVAQIDERSQVFTFPNDLFIVINETYKLPNSTTPLQVVPIRYDDYAAKMSKPFKRPLKHQAWRIINNGYQDTRVVEIIAGPGTDNVRGTYKVRFIKKPKPIIIGPLDNLTINGYCYTTDAHGEGVIPTEGCELDTILHEDILQRAVELAKIAWTSTGQDNLQPVLAAGQRSE